MFGLWFAIYCMSFGILCSLKAGEKNRHKKNWFTIGFIFGVFAYILLLVLPDTNDNEAQVSFNHN